MLLFLSSSGLIKIFRFTSNFMPSHRIPIDQLRVGFFIRLELKWFAHPFLFSSFKIKNLTQIQILKDLGLTEVIWIPEKSDKPQTTTKPASTQRASTAISPPQPESPSLPSANNLWDIKKTRIERLQERNRRIQQCEKQYHRTYGQIKSVMQNLVTGSEEAVEQANSVIHDMVDSLLSEREVVVHLMNVKGKDEGVFFHSLNVAILALLLGKEYGMDADSLQDLGLGALFHDIGKHRIPKRILYKQGPLTPAERQILKLHPKYGAEIASKIKSIPDEAIRVILQHHETENGEGYPEGLKGDEISTLAKIMSIANVYDNYCNRPNPEDSMTPHETLSYMFGRLQPHFDKSLLSLFIRCMGVYPPGTILQLSNDLIGIVVSMNPENQLRPSMLIYDPEIPQKEALIFDLDEEPDLTIARSLRPAQLEPEVYAYLNPRARLTYYVENSNAYRHSPAS
jgi:putative nucleotidyltransferase with HDIG domain